MPNNFRVFIATSPFGKTGRKPLDLLGETGWELIHNPYGRRLKSDEVAQHLQDVDAVIAGTEPYFEEQLKDANRLKVIARVGIGLDSIDLDYCEKHNIRVTYTPDAPSQGVAEMTIANILNLLRFIHQSDTSVREGAWNRLMGKLVCETTIGIIGVGRIGRIVIDLLQPFKPKILAYDIDSNVHGTPLPNVTWASFDEILETSDVLSIHVPLCDHNRNLIDRSALARMKTGSIVINTARGGIVDENALVDALYQRHLGGAALDVFENEPYDGELKRLDNVVLTAHMGASATASRFLMELGATEDCIRILKGETPNFDAIQDSRDEAVKYSN